MTREEMVLGAKWLGLKIEAKRQGGNVFGGKGVVTTQTTKTYFRWLSSTRSTKTCDGHNSIVKSSGYFRLYDLTSLWRAPVIYSVKIMPDTYVPVICNHFPSRDYFCNSYIKCYPIVNLKSARSSHSAQYCRYQTYSDALKNSFFPRTIPQWNSLLLRWSIPRLLRSLGHSSFS